MFTQDMHMPNPYDYASDGDYYEAYNKYNEWLMNLDNIEGEMIDLAYERSLEEKWEREQQ